MSCKTLFGLFNSLVPDWTFLPDDWGTQIYDICLPRSYSSGVCGDPCGKTPECLNFNVRDPQSAASYREIFFHLGRGDGVGALQVLGCSSGPQEVNI